MSKVDPIQLAKQFIGLNIQDFRIFWAIVSREWEREDGDLEAQWFYCGQQMRPPAMAVISAMRGAVASGIKDRQEQPR